MISAPFFDNLITRAQVNPELLNLADKNNLLRIINNLQCLAICGSDERRELWLIIERGSMEDYGDYNEYLENDIISDKEGFEKIWKEEYPDPVKWYLLSVSHYNEEYFVFINNKLTLQLIKNKAYTVNESINNQLILWIDKREWQFGHP